MPQYVEVNGNVIEFPDGMAATDMESAVRANLAALKPAAAVQVGKELSGIPRQVGLTARYGLEGAANTAQMFTEPIRYLTDRAGEFITGKPATSVPFGVMASRAADSMGLPQPRGANERVVGDAARLLSGTGVLGGAAALARNAPGMAGEVASLLSSNMASQAGSAVGAGLAGGSVREANGSPLMQGVASLGGGVVGGMVPGLASGAAQVARSLTGRAPTAQELDIQIGGILQRAGVDYSQIPERVRQGLREEMSGALATGKEINPQALARLADFRAVGATPTRGMISLDPVQITREQNLAKIGANTGDEGLQGLARIQNQNNSTLIRNLNEQGATQGDQFRAGQAAVGGILGRDASLKRGVDAMYEAARNMPGGTIPLDRKPFVDNIYNALARQNKMAFLPEEVDKYLQQFSAGIIRKNGQEFPVPFDANALDNLLTTIATAQRGTTDGNVKAALSIVRNAIDKTPINPVKNQFGGNQVVTETGAQFLRNQDAQAGQFMDALNKARQAAAQRFGWQESSKPVEAAIGGAQPDKFVQQYVLNGSLADAKAVAQYAPTEVKDAILAHLKKQALNGATDEVGKFSQSAYNKALGAIGDRKLSVFFTPEEIGQLKSLGRVASYMQVQPVGSAVNNSNSGALMLGKGLDMLGKAASVSPIAGPLIFRPLQEGAQNLNVAIRTRQAQNVAPGLLAPTQRQPITQSLLLPGMAFGGGLLAPAP